MHWGGSSSTPVINEVAIVPQQLLCSVLVTLDPFTLFVLATFPDIHTDTNFVRYMLLPLKNLSMRVPSTS